MYVRLFLGILAICGLLAGSAYAQSPQISGWTKDSYSEEESIGAISPSVMKYLNLDPDTGEKLKTSIEKKEAYPLDFLSGIQCSGRYCDNKRYKYITGFQVGKPDDTGARTLYSDSQAANWSMCPEGMYIASMWCPTGNLDSYCGQLRGICLPPRLPAGTKAVCDMEKTISEENASSKGNEVTLTTYQLFNGFRCTGNNCDDVTMSWCNIYGDDKNHVGLEVEGATWRKVQTISGGSATMSYTAGLESTTGSSDSVNASATLSVSGQAGFAEVGLEVTAGYAREWNASKASSIQHTVEVSCEVPTPTDGTKIDVYAFTMLAKDQLGNPDLGFAAVSKEHFCTFGKGNIPSPACFPSQCNNEFAENCQKCDGLHIRAALGEKPQNVIARYRPEPETKGAFVEFLGKWTWKDKANYAPATETQLVLYNDKRKDEYTFCHDRKCTSMKGDYTSYSKRSELTLEGVMGEAGSSVVFTSTAAGLVVGEFRKNKNSPGDPDGKITLEQLLN